MHLREPVAMKLTVIAVIVGVAVLKVVEANDHAGIRQSLCMYMLLSTA